MKPNDQRNFVHGRIGRAIGGFLTGGPVGAASGFVRSGGSRGGGGQPTSGRLTGAARCDPRTQVFMGSSRGCVNREKVPGIRGAAERFLPGGATGFTKAGNAVMGQFGAALQPFVEDRMVRTCLPGMVLGKDGLCYNRRDISNKEREYPRGTRPLGTPGEMAALRKAASFGRRMETTVKRMQKIGVLKKPKTSRRYSPPHRQGQTGPGAPGVTLIQQD